MVTYRLQHFPANPSGHDRTLPDQICKYCFDAIVTFHKFRRRLECVRKFSAGLAQLIQGNPVDLIELYTAEGAYLVQLMKSLNVCDEAETNITLEKLIEDLPSFELIDNSQKHQYTVLDTVSAEPPLQEKTPPSSWHVPTNDITNVGVNANVNADSVTEQILPDSHIQCYFYCNTCLEVFPTPERLTTHTARHKSPKPKECGQCLKSFPNKDYHRTHICISYRDDYVCCEKEWAGHVFYNQHDFYCKFCDKRLDTRKDYHAHMESSSHMMHALVIP
uniref:Uncharacterized protein n=1 Tax=Anopheles atroparvus TaxID=41427 RepID=A0A182J6E5_ANOAO